MGQSRNEDALENILGADNVLLEPMSRNEKILHAILGEQIELDEPQSRIEELLMQIYEQGGGGGENKLPSVVDKTVTEITAADIKGTTKIGDYAFAYCGQLKSVIMPNSVTKIGNYAFTQCSLLESVTISKNVTLIQNAAFANTLLKEITIPSGVTVIGESAFSNCRDLREITSLNTTPPILNPNTFFSVPQNATIYVPAESVEAYKAARYWSDRADYIQALPE